MARGQHSFKEIGIACEYASLEGGPRVGQVPCPSDLLTVMLSPAEIS